MAVNYLAELPWKQLTVKHKIKDALLGKALAKLDGTPDAAARLDALADCRAVALKLAKDKTFSSIEEMKDHLAGVAAAVVKETAVVEAAKKTAEKAAADGAKKTVGKQAGEDESGEGEEEQEEGDIPGRLLKGLATVKTGGGKVALPFAAGVGAIYSVLVSKKISGQDKKDLLELAEGKKILKGTCVWEEGKHTFVLEQVQGGLAGKLQKGIKHLTKLSCKVRVRDVGGTMTFDGDTDVDPDAASATPAAPVAPPQPPEKAADVAAKSDPSKSPEVAALQTKLDRIVQGIKQAAGLKNPKMAAKLKDATLAASEAGTFLRKGDAASAGPLVEKAKQLLTEAAALGGSAPAAPGSPEPKKAPAAGGKATATTPSTTDEPVPSPKSEVPPKTTVTESEPPRQRDSSAGKTYDQAKSLLEADIVKIETAIKSLKTLRKGEPDKIEAALVLIKKRAQEAEALKGTDDTAAALKMNQAYTMGWKRRMSAELSVTTETQADAVLKAAAEQNLKDWGEDKLAELKLRPTAVGEEIRAVTDKIARAKTLIGQKLYKQADNISSDAFHMSKAAKAIADAHEIYTNKLGVFAPKLLDLKNKPKSDRVVKDTGAIDTILLEAAGLAALDTREFAAASKLVDKADAALPAAVQKLAAAILYEDARDALTQKVSGLETAPQAEAVKKETVLIRTRLADAKKLADGGQFVEAKALVDKGDAECDAAVKLEAAQGVAAQERAAAQGDINGVGADGDKAQAAAQKLLDDLRQKPDAGVITKEIAALEKWMLEATLAVKQKKTALAKKTLLQVADGCLAANLTMGRRVDFNKALETATKRIETLEAVGTKLATTSGTQIRKRRILPATQASVAGNFDEAAGLLDKVDAEVATAEKNADGLQRYETALALADGNLKALRKHKKAKQIHTEIVDLDKLMQDAAKAATKSEYESALETLAAAEDGIVQAKALAELADGVEPSADDIKNLAKGKGGAAAVDKLVKALGPNPKGKLIKAAIEARFGTTIERLEEATKDTGEMSDTDKVKASGDEASPDLKRMYDLLLKVPPSHTKDNPKMGKIESYKGGEMGSFYRGDDDLVVISAGAIETQANELGKDTEVPGVDELYKPLPDNPRKPMKHFDWTTLHEVGHAVDDSMGFMSKKGSGGNFGGWKDHGSDYGPAAAAAFAEFKYDKDYIEEFMAGATPEKVAAPIGNGAVDPTIWDKRRTDFEEWYGWVNCSTGNGPVVVADGGKANKAALGGRLFQEAYEGNWVSYDISARAKGLTGYQFRAPAEWFAELYAAYELGRLKPKHPAVEWLSKL